MTVALIDNIYYVQDWQLRSGEVDGSWDCIISEVRGILKFRTLKLLQCVKLVLEMCKYCGKKQKYWENFPFSFIVLLWKDKDFQVYHVILVVCFITFR